MKQIIILTVILTITACGKEKKQLYGQTNGSDGYDVSRKIVGLISNRSDNAYLGIIENTNICISVYSNTSIASRRLQIKEQAGAMITAIDKKGKDIIQTVYIEDISFNYVNQSVGYKTEYPQTQQTVVNLSNKLLNLYGKEIAIKSVKETALMISERLYVPPYLVLQDIYSESKQEKLSTATSFVWNADNRNTNGVVVRVTAEDPSNRKIIENIGFTEDDGNYTLDAALLDAIPAEANVLVEVIRGNLKITNDANGNSYKMYAYSSCSHNFIKQ